MVKVERSYPAPESLAKESLKKSGSYNKPDVVERLKKDFHDKCYICELKGLQDPEVEHLMPHKQGEYPERMFDWDNLFWCCGHCNGVKNNGKYDNGIIDCCKQDPEEVIKLSLVNDEIIVDVLKKDDEKAQLTARLIYETFNLKNTGIRTAACENRTKALMKEMNKLYQGLEKYKANPKSVKNNKIMQAILRRESAFAAFKRDYVKERISDYPGIEAFIQ